MQPSEFFEEIQVSTPTMGQQMTELVVAPFPQENDAVTASSSACCAKGDGTDPRPERIWRLGQSCTIYDMSVLVPELQKRLSSLAKLSTQDSIMNVQLDCQNLQELDAAGVQLFMSLAKSLSPNKLELYWPNIPDSCAWFVKLSAQHQHHFHLLTVHGADDV